MLQILLLTVQTCLSQDAYFFEVEQEEPTITIKGNTMTLTRTIRRVRPPEAESITAYHQGLGKGRKYQIQVNLSKNAKEGWVPKIRLGEDTIMYGVIVSHPNGGNRPQAFHIESSDKQKIIKWVGILGKLLRVEKGNIVIDLKERD